MAISPVDGSFLNLISTGDYAFPVVIQSDIMLTKKIMTCLLDMNLES